jgi:hypothetical protein
MALERLKYYSRDRIPEPYSLIVRARYDLLAVRREGDGGNGACMALERLEHCTPIRFNSRLFFYPSRDILLFKLSPNNAILWRKDKS